MPGVLCPGQGWLSLVGAVSARFDVVKQEAKALNEDFIHCCHCSVQQQVDARGLRCPLPLLKAKQALRDLAEGELLRVLATDAGSWRDFRAYAQLSGQVLVGAAQQDGVYCYVLQKKLS